MSPGFQQEERADVERCHLFAGTLYQAECEAADLFLPPEESQAAMALEELVSLDPEAFLAAPLTWLEEEGPAFYCVAQTSLPVTVRPPHHQAGGKKLPAAPEETPSGPPAEVSAGAFCAT